MKGQLVYTSYQPLDASSIYRWYECVDCHTSFPMMNNVIMCNGQEIYLCPWCREDSKPYQNGRGL